MSRPLSRILLKIGALVLIVFIGVPVVLMVIVASSILLYPLNFLQPIVSIIVVGLFIWAVVEVARRVGKPPKDERGELVRTAPIVQLDEADLRLVLDSKDAIGDLRMLSEAMDGAPPATQLLGLAAVADGVLNALPQVPQALDAARPLLVFYLPRVVAAAERLPQTSNAGRHGAADRLAHAAALLGNALRASRTGAVAADVLKLDYAVQALNVSFEGAAADGGARAIA